MANATEMQPIKSWHFDAHEVHETAKLSKLIVNSYSIFEEKKYHICIAYKFRVNTKHYKHSMRKLYRKCDVEMGERGDGKWLRKKTNAHLPENNNEDITVCWLHHSVLGYCWLFLHCCCCCCYHFDGELFRAEWQV